MCDVPLSFLIPATLLAVFTMACYIILKIRVGRSD